MDPNGLSLTNSTSYEALGSGYLRLLSASKPAGATTASTTTYYGDSQPYGEALGLTASVCALPLSTPQYGMAKSSNGPKNSSGANISTSSIYDLLGRLVGQKSTGDNDWTCTTYDARGRVTKVAYSGVGATPARTVSSVYSGSSGDPLVSSVSDSVGTITTTTDLLGQILSYKDVWGTVTTSQWDRTGRLTTTSTAPPGGAPNQTQAYTYNLDDQILTVAFATGAAAPAVIASATYDIYGQLSGVTYPAGAGKAGNGTALTAITRNAAGATTGMHWAFPGQNSVSDTVIRSQSGRVLTNSLVDGTNVAQSSYSYDAAGRLTGATMPQHQLSYEYSSSGGCGSNAAAGADGNRTAASDAHTTSNGVTTTNTSYCYDSADRLTSTVVTNPVSGANPVSGSNLSMVGPSASLAYDAHGNTTTLADESLGYDSTDRHLKTTLTDGTTVEYVRDATDRIVQRTMTPSTSATSSGGAITVDSQVSVDGTALTGSVTAPPVTTTKANETLVALVESDGPQAVNGQTVTMTSPGLTWQLVTRSNGQFGTSEIWKALAVTPLSGEAVTSKQKVNGFHQAITVMALSGVSAIGSSAKASAASGAPNVALTTTKPGSVVFGAGNDWDSASARTPLAGQEIVHEFVDTAVGDDFWSQRVISPSSTPGTITVGASAPTGDRWNLAAVELVPSASVPASAEVSRYGFSAGGDSPDLTISAGSTVLERTLALPGGVIVSITSDSQMWSYGNIHGDVIVVANQLGSRQGGVASYDPFGQVCDPVTGNIGTTPADDAGPANTTTSSANYGWEGSHQKLAEHAAGIATIEMGARQYVASLGRFASMDSIVGGNSNDFNYPNDAVNNSDLDGKASRSKCYNASSKSIIRLRASCSASAKKSNDANGSSRLGRSFAVVLKAKCNHRYGNLVVCTGATRNPGGGGTTFGNVFVTKSSWKSLKNSNVLDHETRHTYQWAHFGLAFAAKYYAAGTKNGGRSNLYEKQAGLADGGY